MIDYFMGNKDLARNHFMSSDGKNVLQEQWKELTAMLNQLGPQKTTGRWKKYWADLK